MEKLKPISIEFFDPYDVDACKQCGECLTHCPIIEYSEKEAQEEMKRLINGDKTKKLLKKCQSCFTCNLYCENNAHPASLILQRWNEQYKEEGIKQRAKYYMTLYPNYPNFRSYSMDHMNKEERDIVKKWASLEPLKGDTLTYPGCNVILTPTLTQTSLLDGLDIRGRLEYCCGETLFRTGYKDQLHQVTARLDKWFNILKPKNLLVLCTAGTNVFKNVLPHYGLTYKFESITSYIDFLWDKIEKGEVLVKKPLNMKVTIQDSCYAKMFGEEYMDLPRKILEYIGCEVIEMDYNRENMKCCGIAAGFSVDSAYSPMRIRSSVVKNIDMAKRTGADALCVYCSGCNQTYFSARRLYFKPLKMEIYHLIELIQLAIGEIPKRMIKKTAKYMFWGNMKYAMPKLFSKKRIKLPEISIDPADDAY